LNLVGGASRPKLSLWARVRLAVRALWFPITEIMDDEDDAE